MVTPNESTVVAKSLLDLIVVEDRQGDGGFADPTGTNEGNWSKALSEIDYVLDQLVASEECPWWQRWRFPRHAVFKCKIMGPSIVYIADLA